MNITDEIRYEADGAVATITIDRPAQRNAINQGVSVACVRQVRLASARTRL